VLAVLALRNARPLGHGVRIAALLAA